MDMGPVSLSEPAFFYPQACVMPEAFAFHLWHSEVVKALKSQLASELLADPKARDQLREFMTGKRGGPQADRHTAMDEFKIRRVDGRSVRVTIVPKATAA
jgi:hypothetical protein